MKSVILAGLVLGLVQLAAFGQELDRVEASEACLDCHDDIHDLTVKTVHQQSFDVTCVDCHGYSEDHIDDMEASSISNPVGAEGVATCLKCHDGDVHQSRPGKNIHTANEVFCDSCHLVHPEAKPPAPLLREEHNDLCLSCHTDVAAIMRKPFTHNLAHGVMTCGDCHNPHGGRGRLGFKQRSLEATCAECHADTSGPHVFEHVTGFVGDCTSCHESHGSSNPRQLTRASISQLCLECHSTLPAGELGSQPPSSHNLRSPRYRDCTVCHTAVHGSSRSPLLLK